MAKSVAPKNEARPPAKPTKSTVSHALKEAINSLSTELLRKELEFICDQFPIIIHTLEDRLLVQGKNVVRYHADTDSEDEANSEIESEEGDSESEKRKPIAIGDEEYTARMAMCKNCKQEFHVTLNDRGDCVWHPGIFILFFERN